MRSRLTSRMITGCILVLLSNSAGSEQYRQYKYLEKTGTVESTHTWLIRHGDSGVETRWIAPDKEYFNLCDETGDTLEWRVRHADTDLLARRSGSTIRFEGTRNGKTIRREVEVDESPWFQPLSYALGRFSRSHQDSVVFWTIRPDNLDVVKLRARKLGEEELATRAGPVLARKISISVDGMLSYFWKAHYWFRRDDSLFVRYEGANGLPGTPKTTIQLDG